MKNIMNNINLTIDRRFPLRKEYAAMARRQRAQGRSGLPHGNEGALTMIELMIVISMIGLAASFAAGIFLNWLPRYRLRCAAYDLFSNLQYARMLAIRKACEVAVVFDAGENAYHLVCGGGNGYYEGLSPHSDDVVERTVRFRNYGSGITFGRGNAFINATSKPMDGFPDDAVSYEHNTAEFDSEGLAHRQGYVYLTNCLRRNAYAVGTPTGAGVVRLRHWTGGAWQ